MHLSKEFGGTVDLIRKDGFKVTNKVKMNPGSDKTESMALSIGKGIIGITLALKKIKPDVTVILGDRIEALASAIASAYLNIPIAHIHGGDKNRAGLDESARHAITKLSHIHFVATKTSMARVIRMGEKTQNVFLVGAPGLDTILKEKLISKNKLAKKYNLDLDKPLLLLVQHSVTTQIDKAGNQMRKTLSAIKKLKLPTFIIYPNSDAGGRAIIKEIKKNKHLSFIKVFKNLPHGLYLSFLKQASVLIGNSSSGIIESSSFKLPAVNIGIRQDGRERSTNIIDAPHDKKFILKAIKKALFDEQFRRKVKKCKNPYGDGQASKHIVKIFSVIKINKKLLQKQITY